MGQKQSKQSNPAKNTSSVSLLNGVNKHISEPRTPNTPLTPLTPVQDITPPAGPRELTRISAIIDPRELLQDGIYNVTPTRPNSRQDLNVAPKAKAGIVHSPSGNIMGAEEFLANPNRPLAMWERQQRVIEATKAGVEKYEAECRLANQNKLGSRLKKMRSTGNLKGKTKSKRTCGCWPF